MAHTAESAAARPGRALPPLVAAIRGRDDRRSGWAPRPRPDDPAEGGVFGPESVTWRVHADPLLGLAGLRALHLRALLPGGLSGLADDAFDPWSGLARMMRYIGVVTFGSTIEAVMAGARIRALHAVLDHEGDPPAVLWGHACQVSSFLEVVRRGGLALSGEEQDAYIREQVRFAALLGLEPEDVPSDRGTLERYLRSMRGELDASPRARAFTGSVVAQHVPAAMAMPDRDPPPPWAPVAGLAFATLPSWARKLYDMPHRTGPAALTPAATTVALHSLRDTLLVAHPHYG